MSWVISSDFDGDFIPFGIRGHGAHALLAGGDYGLRPGLQHLTDFIALAISADSLASIISKVAATAATQTALTIVSHLHKLNTGNGAYDIPRGFVLSSSRSQDRKDHGRSPSVIEIFEQKAPDLINSFKNSVTW
jgi:hypothetical protein